MTLSLLFRPRQALRSLLRRVRSSLHRKPLSAKRRARRALVWGVLFVAALHIGLLYLLETRAALRDPLYHERAALLQLHLRHENQQRATVIMLGTSRTVNAFNARQFQERLTADLNRPVLAFNLGIAGSGPVRQQINLRRLLNAGIKPDLVLLEVLPFYFLESQGRPIEFDQVDLTQISSNEMETFTKYGVSRDTYGERWRQIRLNPWGEMKFQVLRRIRPTWLPPNLNLNWNSNIDRWGWRSVDINVLPPGFYEQYLERAYMEHGRFFPDFHFAEPAVQALVDTLEICRTERIVVALVHLPEDSNFRAWYPPEKREMIENTFAQIARDHGAQWIDAKTWVPDGHTFDGHHINMRGANIFTERLAAECGKYLIEARGQ